jgi:hypothetical protein
MNTSTPTTHETVDAELSLTPKVNNRNFFKEVSRLFSLQSWPDELIQNCLRAKATHIKWEETTDSLTVTDDGHGITELKNWSELFDISSSDWKNAQTNEQIPAGMGIYSVLAKYPCILRSNGYKTETTPEQITSNLEVHITKDKEPIQGFSIQVFKANKDLIAICDKAPRVSNQTLGAETGYRLPLGIIGALYNTVGTKVKITIDRKNGYAADLFYTGLVCEAPWAAKACNQDFTVDYQVQTFDTPTKIAPKDTKWGLTETTHKLVLPAYQIPNSQTFISLVPISHIGKQDWLNFYGKLLPLETTSTEFNVTISIWGKQEYPEKLELKHPDRTEIIKNENYDLFIKNYVTPLLEKTRTAKKQLTQHKPYPLITVVNEKEAQLLANRLFNNFDTETIENSVNAHLYVGTHSEITLHAPNIENGGFNQIERLEPESIPNYFQTGFSTPPKHYAEIEAILNTRWANVNFDAQVNGKEMTLSENNTTNCIIAAAKQGKLSLGILDNQFYRVNKENNPENFALEIKNKIITNYELEINNPVKTLQLTRKQGSFSFEVWTDFTVNIETADGLTKTVKLDPSIPFITVIAEEYFNSQDIAGSTFYVTPGYAELIKTNPKKAHELFYAETTNLYERRDAEEFGETDFTSDEFENGDIALAKNYFIKDDQFETKLKDFIFDNFCENNQEIGNHIPNINNHTVDNLTIKSFTYNHAKQTINSKISFQTNEKSVQAELKNKEWTFEIISREKREKLNKK